MRTRVLPDPAGAMIRAAPEPWHTAANWSGARLARDVTGAGTTAAEPDSTDSEWTTASPSTSSGMKQARGPPSTQAPDPSARRTSPASAPATSATPGSRAALRPHHHTAASGPARAS